MAHDRTHSNQPKKLRLTSSRPHKKSFLFPKIQRFACQSALGIASSAHQSQKGFEMHPKVRHALLYLGVNLGSTVVDYTIFLSLTYVFGLPILQSVIAYTVGMVVNYALTRAFVFNHDMSHKSNHRVFMEFAGTSFLGLLLTAGVIWLTVHEMNLPPIDGKTISVLICFVSLYYVRSRIVFSKNTNAPAAAETELQSVSSS